MVILEWIGLVLCLLIVVWIALSLARHAPATGCLLGYLMMGSGILTASVFRSGRLPLLHDPAFIIGLTFALAGAVLAAICEIHL